MSSFASPLQIATVAAAVAWPFAAGLGVVLWSKARAAGHARRRAAVDSQLQGMFRQVEARGVPPRLALVVDALEEHEALKAAADRAKKASRTGATL
ncbi:hypothetical protein [Phenylobacterium sp.]|jgi:uncharacterized iron-regulated membrane protein|uniref:hypothetical protein n=1 Tax=Phenylobacterium sp. TaxID=1871053 RepID=UPI002F9413C0